MQSIFNWIKMVYNVSYQLSLLVLLKSFNINIKNIYLNVKTDCLGMDTKRKLNWNVKWTLEKEPNGVWDIDYPQGMSKATFCNSTYLALYISVSPTHCSLSESFFFFPSRSPPVKSAHVFWIMVFTSAPLRQRPVSLLIDDGSIPFLSRASNPSIQSSRRTDWHQPILPRERRSHFIMR